MIKHAFKVLPFTSLRNVVSWIVVAVLAASVSSLVSAQCLTTGANEITCSGNSNNYTVVGSTDNDTFIFANGVTGNITIISGGQTTYDTINFSGFLTGVTVDLANQAALQPIAAGLQIWFQGFTVAEVYGGAGNDTITGTAGNDTINGNAGTDTINGGAGNDTLSGGDDSDQINGGAGDDLISGGNDDDTLAGGLDTDTVNGDGGMDTNPNTSAPDCIGDTINVEFNGCATAPVPTPAAVVVDTGVICITDGTRVSVNGSMLLVFSDFRDTTNGMTITHIPLSSLRAPTDEEKASGAIVWVGYQDSEYATGWAAAVYWQNNHYGVVVYKDGGQTVYDDTGAICGWF